MKMDIRNNDFARFMFCGGIGAERDNFDFTADENGMYDVSITFNGKEINTERFIEQLYSNYQNAVKKGASNLLQAEYSKMLDNIYNIQESLEKYDKIFKEKVHEEIIPNILTAGDLFELPFATKIKTVWNDEYHANEEYIGIVFGNKIGWEDGLVDDIKTIAESVSDSKCKAYLVED